MKASELMIGDWVLSLIGTPCRVKIESFVCHDSWEDGNHGAFNFNDVEPIPLTEEILKANEWTEFYYGHFEDENHRHFHRGSDRRLELSLIKGDKCFCTNFSLGRIDFYYVHELQHALRLCGLNDLADNFKV